MFKRKPGLGLVVMKNLGASLGVWTPAFQSAGIPFVEHLMKNTNITQHLLIGYLGRYTVIRYGNKTPFINTGL
jgi:hypothetical protein